MEDYVEEVTKWPFLHSFGVPFSHAWHLTHFSVSLKVPEE